MKYPFMKSVDIDVLQDSFSDFDLSFTASYNICSFLDQVITKFNGNDYLVAKHIKSIYPNSILLSHDWKSEFNRRLSMIRPKLDKYYDKFVDSDHATEIKCILKQKNILRTCTDYSNPESEINKIFCEYQDEHYQDVLYCANCMGVPIDSIIEERSTPKRRIQVIMSRLDSQLDVLRLFNKRDLGPKFAGKY